MGRLRTDKPRKYDDICDFLVDLFRIGANQVEWKDGEFYNPIDDFGKVSSDEYGYTKDERREVQENVQLRKNQERQFMEYSGQEDVAEGLYKYVNNKLFYWKNQDYSSHALHPFMYNLKLWNKLNNIIVNGYKDYVDIDLIGYLSSKAKFDELFGKFGEGKNFWKYNVMDMTGYTTRYEAAVKDEHLDDTNQTISELTGYDGLFYPQAAKDFLRLLGHDEVDDTYFDLPDWFFKEPTQFGKEANEKHMEYFLGKGDYVGKPHPFVHALYAIYWQMDEIDGFGHPFYIHWYSHLNYTRSEYQRLAMQLWYWRDRIKELITIEYPLTKYCIDVQGNSLIMVSTFKDGDEGKNPYLIDLVVAQNEIQERRCGNKNTHVPFCENQLRKPSELWIRWKSNPLAIPAFDVYYDEQVGDQWFDHYFRNGDMVEFGQLTHTNSKCNEWFKLVLAKWRDAYKTTVHWEADGEALDKNRLPVFFDMEQSAHVLALASWYKVKDEDGSGIVNLDEWGN